MDIAPIKPIFGSDLEAIIYLPRGYGSTAALNQRASQDGYREQTDRHITVLGDSWDPGKSVIIEATEKDKKELIRQITEWINEFEWEFELKEIYHIDRARFVYENDGQKDMRKAYIRSVEMPDMERLYQRLNEQLGLKMPTQFPHSTLFTIGERPNPKYYGISIPSKAEFERMNPMLISK